MEPKIEFGLCMDAKKLHLHDAWTDVKRNYKLMSDWYICENKRINSFRFFWEIDK